MRHRGETPERRRLKLVSGRQREEDDEKCRGTGEREQSKRDKGRHRVHQDAAT